MANKWENNENLERLYFLGLQNDCRQWLPPWKLKTFAPWVKSYDKHRQHIKKQKHDCSVKVHIVKAMVFPVVMYRCENWTIKMSTKELMLSNCDDGEDSWESLGLQGGHMRQSQENQSWIFIGRTDAEAETPILWLSDAKSWLIGKDPDAQKDWRQEKGVTENEVVG